MVLLFLTNLRIIFYYNAMCSFIFVSQLNVLLCFLMLFRFYNFVDLLVIVVIVNIVVVIGLLLLTE